MFFNENFEKLYTCCFSGHRPHKFYRKGSLADSEYEIKTAAEIEILQAIDEGFTNFIVGGGLGFDLYAAEILVRFKRRHEIKLRLAAPCFNYDKFWSDGDRLSYESIWHFFDEIVYVTQGEYTKSCMYDRNKYMVDHSSLLIAYYNGTAGGTKQTVEYAKKRGLAVRTLSS